jgi:hypothetical protein
MSTARAHPLTIADLGEELARYRRSLPAPARSRLRVRSQDDRVILTVTRGAGLRVFVDSNIALLGGARLPRFEIEVQRFETATETSTESTRLVFWLKTSESGASRKRGSSVKDEFSARVRSFFDTAVVAQLHEAALKAALKAPTEFETILNALERPEVAASVRDQDPLAAARLRGIEAKRRILTEDGGLLSAEKVGDILTMSRQAVEKRRKAGRLIGITLGRRGFGYPAWQFTERGTLPHLETVLDALRKHDAWTKLVFLTTENAALNGRKPVDALRAGQWEEVVAAARIYGEQGAV